MGPELRAVQVEAGPSGAHRVLFGGEEPDVGTSTVRGQDARHGGPTDPERERDPEGSVPSTWDVGGREEGRGEEAEWRLDHPAGVQKYGGAVPGDRTLADASVAIARTSAKSSMFGLSHRDRSGPDPSPHVDGVAESSSEAKAKAVGEEKEEEEGAEPAAAVRGTSPHRERFDGFAKTNRKWFDESGYSGCLERLEELEGIVEAQFRDLHAKGYGVPKPASIGKDGPLKLKLEELEELEELERAVERQHRTLVDSGILPTDSLPIFAAK